MSANTCPLCGVPVVSHVYCSIADKHTDVITSRTLAGQVAADPGGTRFPTAAAQLATVQQRLATVAPSSDGTEPW